MSAFNPIPCHPCFKDLSGQRFGRLVVIGYLGRTDGTTRWMCRCDCGTEKPVRAASLVRGNTKSCGCLHDELLKKRCKTHGHAAARNQSPEYKTWCGIIKRCENENSATFQQYGARGVGVCDGFRNSFGHFLAVVGGKPSPAHSIDRIENHRGYECGQCEDCGRRGATVNCRWATSAEQSRNTNRNVMVTINGETRCLTDWAAAFGINIKTVRDRIKRCWPVERALSVPVQHFRIYRG